MNRYDPERAPDPQEWLLLDESERMRLVEKYHRIARDLAPSVRGHALMHVIVENQVAEPYSPTVDTLARLQSEGLTRHQAIHAVASVLSELLAELEGESAKRPSEGEIQARILAGCARLRASDWR